MFKIDKMIKVYSIKGMKYSLRKILKKYLNRDEDDEKVKVYQVCHIEEMINCKEFIKYECEWTKKNTIEDAKLLLNFCKKNEIELFLIDYNEFY